MNKCNVNAVIHLIESLDDSRGGPAKSIPYMVEGLKQYDSKHYLVSCRRDALEKNELVSRYGLSHIAVKQVGFKKLRYAPTLISEVNSIIKNSAQTILHVHNLWNFVPYSAWRLSKKFGYPLIISPRGGLFPWCLEKGSLRKKIAMNLFQRNMLQHAHCIHVTSENELNVVRDLGITAPVALVKNCIDLSQFQKLAPRSKACAKLNLNPSDKFVLFLSRIDAKKGLDILIKAFFSNNVRCHDWKLLIAGPIYDYDHWNNCQNLVKNANMQDRVIYMGMLRSDMRMNALAAANIFALPSHTENFGVAILEALAAGLPVLTSNNTPWKEISLNKAGVITPVESESVARALSNLMTLKKKEELEMKFAAKSIAKIYSTPVVSDKMNSVYEYILHGGMVPEFIQL